MQKPPWLFDRDEEWRALTRFAASRGQGASLGLVYGRRRQGKTYLLETLAHQYDGFYVSALQQSGAQNRRRLASLIQQFTGARLVPALDTWEDAMQAVLALGEERTRPVVAVLDEFPYLVDSAPELPSILQDLLRPRGAAATSWPTRLILCGSAISTMSGLLAGSAPLRGRAALELVVHPFGYRDAASFWGVTGDLDVAFRLHALVGGTPAYQDMSGGRGPDGEEFDDWVVDRLLRSSSAMFREGSVLLAEQPQLSDASLYVSVLAAIAAGRTRRGEIAEAVGRPTSALAHALGVLETLDLVRALDDAFRQRRRTYQIADPVLRLHRLVIAPNEAALARRPAQVWGDVADTVSTNIYGPHFEQLAREWCEEHSSQSTLGGRANRVLPAVVACREHGTNHEIDAVVVSVSAGRPDAVLAIGEAKASTRPVDVDQIDRLGHLRDLVRSGETDRPPRLLLFARAGFTPRAVSAAQGRGDVELVDLVRLYHGS